MNHLHINTSSKKNKHLTLHDRDFIERHASSLSITRIAFLLGKSRRTIQRELHRGMVSIHSPKQKGQKINVYSAQAAHQYYLKNRSHCHRPFRSLLPAMDFIKTHLKQKRYSPVVIAYFLKQKNISIAPSTLYYHITHHPHLFQLHTTDYIYARKPRHSSPKSIAKSIAGTSIELRDPSILTRKTFGHWEMDSVVGGRNTSKATLLVLTERKTRYQLIFKLKAKTSACVEQALDDLEMGLGSTFKSIFKTITVDNGSEFSNRKGIETSLDGTQRTQLFYCHAYASYERGSNENANRMIRRFIPKGKDIATYHDLEIATIMNYMNRYPRKLFQFSSSEERFKKECGFIF